ncbi:ABC transporter ABCE [Heracleum sosnowskyi]|uniref:ABC transporter ABCE n=1 Tax=Heracleum sosnowskyi TaxID=360622 RepID=A0AAD8MQC8_9APIA|nr:ABC transporter ABCE [Heracleum sosnowskyi]
MALSFTCYASFNPQLRGTDRPITQSNKKCLEKVKNVVRANGVCLNTTSPHESLQKGSWVKLICGASFEDVVDIRNLSLVYTLAGVDCIDCAADGSVVNAVNEGIEAARAILPIRRPWIMISVNDHEDLHFRKAQFDPDDCPLDCSRPCENVCPANAISLSDKLGAQRGVLTERCYGCGRCFPVCPYDKIMEITYIRDAAATAELLKRSDVDAVEIHTSGRHISFFKELWDGLGDSVSCLKLVAVSLPDIGDKTISVMNMMYSAMEANMSFFNLWQLDGRPMSGDIGRGATREAIAFAVRVAAAKDKPQGFLQLAGGTNAHTVDGLRKHRLFQTTTTSTKSENKNLRSTSPSSTALIGGVAYGGYARKIVGRILNSMQALHGHAFIEDHPEHLVMALTEALALVGPIKCYPSS